MSPSQNHLSPRSRTVWRGHERPGQRWLRRWQQPADPAAYRGWHLSLGVTCRPRRPGRRPTVCSMRMTGGEVGPADALGLADAIGLLRDELLEAHAAGAGSDIQLPVESMTVEL